MKVFVNIYNKGKFLGVKLPVYNFPLEESVVKLLKEMNFHIEVVDPKKKQNVNAIQTTQEKPTALKNVITPKLSKIVEESKIEEWQTHDVYTEEELKNFSKNELKKILNYRGHHSNKTGPRDRLAPKFDDNKTVLIQKVLETNKK